MSLRIKDIDFAMGRIHLWTTKGSKARLVPLPNVLIEPLQNQIACVRRLRLRRETALLGYRFRTPSLENPNRQKEFSWYFLFASRRSAHAQRLDDSADIIRTNPTSGARLSELLPEPASQSESRRIHFATVLRRICCRQERT
ncbi:MAG: hypothetical protein IPL86_19255 [Flavobacteriales bacterium]|nr:hypothetical protein [Flavobacteriales bacterium]